jgi:hypothetical protein
MNLSVSRLVKVNVILAALAAQAQSLSTLLVLTSGAIIDAVERLRSYSSLAAVAIDFGTSGPEYLAAVLYFQQTPQPSTISFGRWVKTASYGHLKCAPLSTANTLIAACGDRRRGTQLCYRCQPQRGRRTYPNGATGGQCRILGRDRRL